MSTRSERSEAIDFLENEIKDASGVYLTDFHKINVEKINSFRTNLRETGSKYIVVKNSLAQIAMERCGFEKLVPFVKGPIGLAISNEDGVQPAKAIKKFKKDYPKLLEIKGAVVDGTLYDASEIKRLADIPSREILLSQFASCLCSPLSSFAGALNGMLTKFVGTLEAVKNKKSEQ